MTYYQSHVTGGMPVLRAGELTRLARLKNEKKIFMGDEMKSRMAGTPEGGMKGPDVKPF